MRVAVVFFTGKSRGKTLDIAKGLAKGIESQEHMVDIVDGDNDVNTRLSVYEYIALGTSAINAFGGKVSEKVGKFLSDAGGVAGKRCFAFAVKRGVSNAKTLASIMQVMEREGMYIK